MYVKRSSAHVVSHMAAKKYFIYFLKLVRETCTYIHDPLLHCGIALAAMTPLPYRGSVEEMCIKIATHLRCEIPLVHYKVSP
jgi:hypothetical protein